VANESNEFIGMKIAKDEKGQLLQLICADGTTKIYKLRNIVSRFLY